MAEINRLHIRPKQSLGQNFLTDDNIARNIVREIHLKETDTVVEIGPGHGGLTKYLIGKARKLFLVEIDERLVTNLREKFQRENVEIIHQDFLNVRLSECYEKFKTRIRLVGNIPYHLTSPILFKTFEERNFVQDITIMIQREVARRITAKSETKDYGILSVFSQFYGTPKIIFNVSPNCFYPKPKVTSTIVQIRFNDKYLYKINEKLFSDIVRTTFGKRRKTLKNSLSYLPYGKDTIANILENVDFEFDKRPEQLSVGQFVQLTKMIDNIIG